MNVMWLQIGGANSTKNWFLPLQTHVQQKHSRLKKMRFSHKEKVDLREKRVMVTIQPLGQVKVGVACIHGDEIITIILFKPYIK